MFLARDLVEVGRSLEPDEFIDVVDVELDKALDMISSGEIEDSKTVVALLMAARKLSGGWIG